MPASHSHIPNVGTALLGVPCKGDREPLFPTQDSTFCEASQFHLLSRLIYCHRSSIREATIRLSCVLVTSRMLLDLSNGTRSTQYNSVEASRTMPSLLLKTFTLRIAVMAAYGHLGTLQGLSEKWRTALPRMIILFVYPGATLAGDFLSSYVLTLFNITSVREWSWRLFLLWAAGYKIEYQWKTVRYDGMTSCFSDIGLFPFSSLSYTPLPWSWDRLILKSGRLVSLTIVLAQAIASLILVVRRLRLHAALLSDWSNGLYAIIGILSVCHSFVLMAIDGGLEIRGNGISSSSWTTPHKVTITILDDLPEFPRTNSWPIMVFELFWGLWPTQYIQGQVLLEASSIRPSTSFMEGSLPNYIPALANLIIIASVYVAQIGFCGQGFIRRYIRSRRNQDARTGAFWLAEVDHLELV